MITEELINIPEYWQQRSVRPRGYAEICDMVETHGRLTGIWETTQWDPKTGEIRKRVISKNVVTDNGAINILASAIANASNANPWNNILITNNDGSTTLTGAGFTAGQTAITSLPCAALPAAIPSGTYLILGYGSGSAQGGYNASGVLPSGVGAIITSGATAQGATAITVLSFTSTNIQSAGAAIVPVPMYADNPTNANLTANATTPLSKYSGVIVAGGFVYTPTTGAGNRNVVVTFIFKDATNGGTTAVGNYTSEWLVNVTSAASNATTGLFVGNYVNHNINTPMRCDDFNNITSTATIKM
jgi:hypothetical protein